jgi:hypothetical protein
VSHLDGVDVTEGSVVTEHLNVKETYDVLFHLPFGDIGFRDSTFEGFYFTNHDSVFLCFRSGFTYRLHELEELLRLAEPALGSHGEFSPDRL